MKNVLIFIGLFVFSLVMKANENIVLNSDMYGIDHNKMLIVSNKNVSEINTLYPDIKSSVTLDVNYVFSNSVQTIEIGIAYSVVHSGNSQVYVLYFTELPLIYISTENTIVDEPRLLADFMMVETDENITSSNIGIEYRGGYSQSLAKKSFRIEFWEDEIGEETLDFSLLGMRSDDDWNLQAMFNEPLRFLSKTNFDLWRLLHIPHYINDEPDAVNGITMKYSELFINGEYRGVYAVSERIDRKQLKLKKHNGNIRGELYKGDTWGASTFTSLPAYDNSSDTWGGWEYKHPEEEINWSNLYNFTDFVMNESNSVFYAEYQNKLEIDNFVDYFIFLNVLRATDNTGKNTHLAKYNTNEPYFYVPWDLDGTFGIIWDGSQENITTGLLSNGLYNRLWLDCSENGFREKLQIRWNSVKQTIFNHDFLMGKFNESYSLLLENGVYQREEIAWEEYQTEFYHLDYMSTWITNRLSYLDTKFNEECVMSTSDFSTQKIKFYPNPAKEVIYFDNTDNKSFSVSVYDVQGKILIEKTIENSSQSISVSSLNSGVYFVKVKTDSSSQTEKIIISR